MDPMLPSIELAEPIMLPIFVLALPIIEPILPSVLVGPVIDAGKRDVGAVKGVFIFCQMLVFGAAGGGTCVGGGIVGGGVGGFIGGSFGGSGAN